MGTAAIGRFLLYAITGVEMPILASKRIYVKSKFQRRFSQPWPLLSVNSGMNILRTQYRRHRFPTEIIQYIVWLYNRLNLSRFLIKILLSQALIKS